MKRLTLTVVASFLLASIGHLSAQSATVFSATNTVRAGSMGFQALGFREIGQQVVMASGYDSGFLDDVVFRLNYYGTNALVDAPLYVTIYSVQQGTAPIYSADSVWNPYIPNTAPGYDNNFPAGWVPYNVLQSMAAKGTIDGSTWLYNSTAPDNWITYSDLVSAVNAGSNQPGLVSQTLVQVATVTDRFSIAARPDLTNNSSFTSFDATFDFFNSGFTATNSTLVFALGLTNANGISLPGSLSTLNVQVSYPAGSGTNPSVGAYTNNMLTDRLNSAAYTVLDAQWATNGTVTNFSSVNANLPVPSSGMFAAQPDGYSPFYRPVFSVTVASALTNNTVIDSTNQAAATNDKIAVAGGETIVEVPVAATNITIRDGTLDLQTNNLLTNAPRVNVLDGGVLTVQGSNAVGSLNLSNNSTLTLTNEGSLRVTADSTIGDGTTVSGATSSNKLIVQTTTFLTLANQSSVTNLTVTIEVEENGTLKGVGGTSGVLEGAGTISPGNSPGILEANGGANSVDLTGGLDFDLEFTLAGAPAYGTPAAPGNDIFRLVSGTTFNGAFGAANTIRFFLNPSTPFVAGVPQTFQGGFFLDGAITDDIVGLIAGATKIYYVADPSGPLIFEGVNYRLASEFDTSLANVFVPAAGFSGGTASGTILSITASAPVPEPATWAAGALLAGCAIYRRWRRKRLHATA